jgi:hypothetical protein
MKEVNLSILTGATITISLPALIDFICENSQTLQYCYWSIDNDGDPLECNVSQIVYNFLNSLYANEMNESSQFTVSFNEYKGCIDGFYVCVNQTI